MPAALRVPAGVLVGGVIAAADLAALQADAQMQPRVARPQALLAALRGVGQLREMNVLQMGAGRHLRHKQCSSCCAAHRVTGRARAPRGASASGGSVAPGYAGTAATAGAPWRERTDLLRASRIRR